LFQWNVLLAERDERIWRERSRRLRNGAKAIRGRSARTDLGLTVIASGVVIFSMYI
jgi:hypothetical protein